MVFGKWHGTQGEFQSSVSLYCNSFICLGVTFLNSEHPRSGGEPCQRISLLGLLNVKLTTANNNMVNWAWWHVISALRRPRQVIENLRPARSCFKNKNVNTIIVGYKGKAWATLYCWHRNNHVKDPKAVDPWENGKDPRWISEKCSALLRDLSVGVLIVCTENLVSLPAGYLWPEDYSPSGTSPAEIS